MGLLVTSKERYKVQSKETIQKYKGAKLTIHPIGIFSMVSIMILTIQKYQGLDSDNQSSSR